MSPRIFQPKPSPAVTPASRAFQPPRPFASPAPESAVAQGAGARGHDFARISVRAPEGGAPGGVVQRTRKKPLSPKAQENRARLLAKQARRYEREARIMKAERGFHELLRDEGGKPLVEADPERRGISGFHFPLDRRLDQKPTDTEPIEEALDRLPVKLRKSEGFRRVLALPDSEHGQEEPRTEVGRGELQEALAGWQFAQETGLKPETIRPGGSIDYYGQNAEGREVPFDPFLSPSEGEGRVTSAKTKDTWAAAAHSGSYYKHTHGKGGDPRTVGVWDKTYTTGAEERDLKARLEKSGATKGAKVHELRVPLARMFAEEHVAAEDQIERSKKESAAKAAFHASVAKRYAKAQRGKAPEKRVSLEEALKETGRGGEPTQRARYWQAELAKYRS